MDSDFEVRLAGLTEQLDHCHSEVENLEVAVATRHVIGVAQGMLMLRYGLTQEQTFAYLKRHSQVQNVKLREIARRMVIELGKERWPAQP